MRVYLPIAPAELSADEFAPRTAYARTPALRAALPEEDEEGGEASAYLAAADAAVELAGPAGRRIVLAADAPDASVRPLTGEHPGAVELTAPLARRDVASIHLDEPEAAPDVRAAATGDEGALERAAERDLLWYDPTELDALVAELG